jgi:23S rRNA pseudouridine2605 synthase
MEAGRVTVNGVVVVELGTRVDPARDEVAVDGVPVAEAPRRWVVYHKPSGLLTTRSDPHGGRTIYDDLPADLSTLRYVGRLDRDAEGLLLLTNDGETAHALQHPSGEIEREYWVEVAGSVRPETLRTLVRGVELDDGPARAVRTAFIDTDGVRSHLTVVLAEGRKREVRRMLSAVGHAVLRLRRTRFGPVRLGNLAPGGHRAMTASEIADLRRLTSPSIRR